MNSLKTYSASQINAKLAAIGTTEVAVKARRFCKTGPGEYAEGDKFHGVRVPVIRQLAKQHQSVSMTEVSKLLRNEFHEARLCALFILVHQYQSGNEKQRTKIITLYLASTAYVNNWDLVDSSAYHLLGPWLNKRNRAKLTKLAKSSSLWERRIAIIATLHFIRLHDFKTTLQLAKVLKNDSEDLIQKAVGWMLREVGNRNQATLYDYLDQHATTMPRTMLRYAIEKLPKSKRSHYLAKPSQ